LQQFAYLNSGTAGPLPKSVHAAIRHEGAHEFQQGRGNFAKFGRFIRRRENTRQLVARLMGGVEPDDVALMHHTSEGMNTVLWGLDWKPGDVLLTTTLEHDALAVPAALLRDRLGVELRFVDIGLGESALDRLSQALEQPRVRLLAVSHIVWSTGALMPIAELAARARERGVLTLVDGAQSGGLLPLDLPILDVDAYTVSGQKWLCGPEGSGALYLGSRAQQALSPTFASYFSPKKHDYRGEVTWQPGARRYECAMMNRPGLAGFERALIWMLDEVGLPRAWGRAMELARQARYRLEAEVPGLNVVGPGGLQSPLVTFHLDGLKASDYGPLANRLSSDHQVVTRSIDCPPYGLRAAFGFFNSEQDTQRLISALKLELGSG
jgi:L-cysteine/cystine lyase